MNRTNMISKYIKHKHLSKAVILHQIFFRDIILETDRLKYLCKIRSIPQKSTIGIVFIKYMIQINILKRINIMSLDKFSYDIERNGHQGKFIY